MSFVSTAPPRPSTEPIRVQRRASNTGVIMVAGQKVALGQIHQHQTVTVLVCDTTLAIEFPDGDTKVVRRTTSQPVHSIKGQRPRIAASIPRSHVAQGVGDSLHNHLQTIRKTADRADSGKGNQ
jgi:hypothetical protein